MTEPGHDIDPCPFCGGEAHIIEGEVSVGCGCGRCGAVGRLVFLDKAPVIAAAIAAWNTRRTPKPPASRAETTVLPGAKTGPSGSGGGPKQKPKAKTNGTPKPANKSLEPNQVETVARLRAWFAAHQSNPEKAVKGEHKDLGASAGALYDLLKGKRMRQATLASIEAALDRLETRAGQKPPVKVLGNKFPPITGVNPIPSPHAPARCSRTP